MAPGKLVEATKGRASDSGPSFEAQGQVAVPLYGPESFQRLRWSTPPHLSPNRERSCSSFIGQNNLVRATGDTEGWTCRPQRWVSPAHDATPISAMRARTNSSAVVRLAR